MYRVSQSIEQGFTQSPKYQHKTSIHKPDDNERTATTGGEGEVLPTSCRSQQSPISRESTGPRPRPQDLCPRPLVNQEIILFHCPA
ncbi:hypothetical protein GDO81_025607 [Engystomops pustulosus]|uniref:Uncharacterized protein n=1 Tax=Engystomops pustulosus TaxID=76066 RepID=A0AAV6YS70_ENGPU|nr:hypothetical protein GDO81_025607 [Engystomops pustulosus]